MEPKIYNCVTFHKLNIDILVLEHCGAEYRTVPLFCFSAWVLWSGIPYCTSPNDDGLLLRGQHDCTLDRHVAPVLAVPGRRGSSCCTPGPPLLEVRRPTQLGSRVLQEKAGLTLLFRILPESPSWLLVVGREEEAISTLSRVAAVNRRPFQV